MMAHTKSGARRIAGVVAGGLLIAGLGIAVGVLASGGLAGTGRQVATMEDSYGGAASSRTALPSAPEMNSYGAEDKSMEGAEAVPQAAAPADTMIIRNATLEIRVREIEAALAEVRSTAKRNGAEITDSQVISGEDGGPRPLTSAEPSYRSPASASLTLRVPASDLEALITDLQGVGDLIAQGSSASDVTQQYVDIEARLKNLKAQEAQLRSLYARAEKISDLLSIEQELARVRGEIESMQAQSDYLKRQVDKATLVLTLTEPGPIVSPSGSDWGFVDAIRNGIRGALALVNALITVLIAVAPVALVGAVVWFVVRRATRARRERRSAEQTEETEV